MNFSIADAEVFVPDQATMPEALSRVTHLAVGAHQDDLEIMAADGILKCFQQSDKWFAGVVVTNGGGSPRTGLYAHLNDDEMMAVRRIEQKKAAIIGDYGAQFLLNHPSSAVKDGANQAVVDDLVAVLKATRPEVIYTHNPADKHDTHVGVLLKLIAALRRLPKEERPKHLYGCEVWRDLDWLCDEDKVAFDVSAHEICRRRSSVCLILRWQEENAMTSPHSAGVVPMPLTAHHTLSTLPSQLFTLLTSVRFLLMIR